MLVNKTLWGLTNCCEINISKLDFYNTSGVHLNLWPRYPSKEQAWSLQRWASKIGNIPKIIIIVILVNFLVIVELAVALFEISFIFSVRKQTDSRLRSAVHSQDTKTKVNHILEDKKEHIMIISINPVITQALMLRQTFTPHHMSEIWDAYLPTYIICFRSLRMWFVIWTLILSWNNRNNNNGASKTYWLKLNHFHFLMYDTYICIPQHHSEQ